jgi:hypothetical protein
MIPYSQFTTQIRAILFPYGEAENQISAHDLFFVGALIELQRVVPKMAEKHRDIIPFCDCYFECASGMTVILNPPRGRISRIVSLADNCCEVNYEFHRDLHELREFSRRFFERWELPMREPDMPIGLVKSDSRFNKLTQHRAIFGKFSLHNERLYVAPRLNSNERLLVEWSGYKRAWSDSDLIWEDPELSQAVLEYVKTEHIRHFEPDSNELVLHENKWQEHRQNLIIDGMIEEEADLVERRIVNVGPASCQSCSTGSPCYDADAAVSPDADFVFVSDTGPTEAGTTWSADVMKLAASFNPRYVVHGGDVRHSYMPIYRDVFDVDTFYDYLRTPTAATNRFWPAIGNHDTYDGDLYAGFNRFFPVTAGRHYYDVVIGDIHWFFLSTWTNEPDGWTYDSEQAGWLRPQLQTSQAKWKIVVSHVPPYTNHSGNFNQTWMRSWPFKTWGADLVLSGHTHAYERFEVGGLPHIVGGWSGAVLTTLALNHSGTKAKFNSTHGLVRGYVESDRLKLEAVTVDGAVIDTLLLSK